MIKYSDLEVNPYGMDREELNRLGEKLAKRANQRMLRLERATSAISGESYASYGAYVNYAVPALTEGRSRFEENVSKMNIHTLQSRILALQKFLNAESSTVSGQRAIEKRRIETFSSGKWGRGRYSVGELGLARKLGSASNREFYEFLNSSQFQQLLRLGYDSEDVVEIYDQLTDEGDFSGAMDKIDKALNSLEDEGFFAEKSLTDFLELPPLQ